ncbi:hypothetical protein M9434_006764 [Picochlorum sp. BPE23]|nr:hypothetical protein M9434_006764 [Picochlorum sp. BPE23]
MVEGQTISGDAEGSRKDDRLSASAKPFRPSALVIDGDDEGDETGNQYKTPRSSVMKSSFNGVYGNEMPSHAQFGPKTRMLLEGLDQVPFTPSQGVCTPSPNNMATALLIEHHHHHHHVVCSSDMRSPQVNNAFLAGVAAGRAAAQSQSYRQDASQHLAMREKSEDNNLIQAVYQGGNRTMMHQARKDVLASPAGGPQSTPSQFSSRQQSPYPSKTNTSTFERNLKTVTTTYDVRNSGTDSCENAVRVKGEPSKSDKSFTRPKAARSIDMDKARSFALHICSAEGVGIIDDESQIPQELIDLATLLMSLDIPLELATCPASQFSSPKKSGTRTEKFTQGLIKLNARQRRTLRRSQERAWKVLDELRQGGEAHRHPEENTHGSVHDQNGYMMSPLCARHGNPTAFADYSCMVMHPIHMVSMPSPTQVVGYYPNSLMSSPHGKIPPYHHHHPPVQMADPSSVNTRPTQQ